MKKRYFIILLIVFGLALKYWESTKEPIEVLSCTIDSRHEIGLKGKVFDITTDVINRKNVPVSVELEGHLINNKTGKIRDTKNSTVILNKRGLIFGDKEKVEFKGLDGETGEEYICEVIKISVEEAPPGIIFRD